MDTSDQAVNKARFKDWIDADLATKEFMIAANSIIEHMLWDESCLKPLWRTAQGSKSKAMDILKKGFKWDVFTKYGVTEEIFEHAADHVMAFYNDGCEMEWDSE